MPRWLFMDYVSPAGTNQIKKWSRKKLSIQGREDFETMLSMLAKQQTWDSLDFKLLSGKHLQGIGEIIFKSEQGTPLRVACMWGTDESQYILLVGFSHKGKVYDPPTAFDLAIQRKQLLATGEGNICEHEEDD